MMCNYHVLIFLGAKCEDMVLENRETIMVRELREMLWVNSRLIEFAM